MFKRSNDYLMQMDVEVNYAPIETMAAEGLDAGAVQIAALQSFIRHVARTAKEAVAETGQSWRGIDVDAEGESPRFSVRFKGDTEGAHATLALWGEKVEALNWTGRILRAGLRGSDGTNLQYMDPSLRQEYEEVWNNLSGETINSFDEAARRHRGLDIQAG